MLSALGQPALPGGCRGISRLAVILEIRPMEVRSPRPLGRFWLLSEKPPQVPTVLPKVPHMQHLPRCQCLPPSPAAVSPRLHYEMRAGGLMRSPQPG